MFWNSSTCNPRSSRPTPSVHVKYACVWYLTADSWHSLLFSEDSRQAAHDLAPNFVAKVWMCSLNGVYDAMHKDVLLNVNINALDLKRKVVCKNLCLATTAGCSGDSAEFTSKAPWSSQNSIPLGSVPPLLVYCRSAAPNCCTVASSWQRLERSRKTLAKRVMSNCLGCNAGKGSDSSTTKAFSRRIAARRACMRATLNVLCRAAKLVFPMMRLLGAMATN